MEHQTKQPLFYDYEGLLPDPISVPCDNAKLSSQVTKTITFGMFKLSQIEEAITNIVGYAIKTKGVVTTHTHPCLFDCACYSNHYSYLPDIKVAMALQDWTLNVEFFSEVLHQLRTESVYSQIVDESMCHKVLICVNQGCKTNCHSLLEIAFSTCD